MLEFLLTLFDIDYNSINAREFLFTIYNQNKNVSTKAFPFYDLQAGKNLNPL